MKDNQFATQLLIIIGVLVGLTVLILALANVLISDVDFSEDAVIQGNIEERIKPVGNVNLAGATVVATNTAESSASVAGDFTEPAADSGLSAEKIYEACSACHATGVLNAPKLADKASWEPRIAKGVDQLYASAINGIGTMPPKGGRVDYSDDDIKKAVDYMLESVQ